MEGGRIDTVQINREVQVKRRGAIFLIFLAVMLSSGCAAVPLLTLLPIAGAAYEGYVVWKGREATKYYGHDLATVYQSVKKASEELKLESTTRQLASNSGYHIDTKGSMPMQIDILVVEKSVTKVVITISQFGDKQYAEFFYKTVEEYMPKKAATTKRQESLSKTRTGPAARAQASD